MAKMSKRKARKLRREGSMRAPMPKIGIGHVVHPSAGRHENKYRKKLAKIQRKELD